MALPVLLDTAQKYLFADEDKMVADGLPAPTAKRIVRIREAYNYLVAHPSKQDKEIIDRLISFGEIAKSQAYEDLKIIKALCGSLQQASKDYHRWRASEGLLHDIAKARATGNIDASIKAWAQYIKLHQLDKPEREELGVDVKVQPFKPTDNPEVIGISRMPNVRQKRKELLEKYWSEDVQDVEFEQIEFNEDEIFNPKKNGGANA